jgi:hypothetical protein
MKTSLKTLGLTLLLAGMAIPQAFAGGTAKPVEADEGCSGADTGYDKGFFIKTCDGNYMLKVKGYMQLRFAFSDPEGTGNNGDSFLARRVRLNFSGNLINPNFTYLMEFSFEGLPTATANNILHYAFLNYKISDPFQIEVGLHKVFYNRQEITSNSKQQFIEHSLASNRFNLGRSIGVVVHGDINEKMFQYYLSVINGRNTKDSVNTDAELGFVGKFMWNVMGDYGFEESNVSNSDDPSLVVGVAGALFHEKSTVALGNQDRVIAGNADIGFKYKRLSVQGEGFYRNTDPNQILPAQTDLGYYLQAGYFIVPKHFEFAVRASGLLDDITGKGDNVNMGGDSMTGLGGANAGTDIGGDSDNEYEYSAVANYYFKGHDLKLQAQYTFLLDGVAGANDIVNHIAMMQVVAGF